MLVFNLNELIGNVKCVFLILYNCTNTFNLDFFMGVDVLICYLKKHIVLVLEIVLEMTNSDNSDDRIIDESWHASENEDENKCEDGLTVENDVEKLCIQVFLCLVS